MRNLRIGAILLLSVVGILFLSTSFFFGVAHLFLAGVLFFLQTRDAETKPVSSSYLSRMPHYYSALAGGIAVVLLLGGVVAMIPYQMDVSFGSRFSLSARSQAILREVKSPMTLYHVDAGDRDAIHQEKMLIQRLASGLTTTDLSVRSLKPLYDAQLVQEFQLQQQDRIVLVVNAVSAEVPRQFVRISEVNERELLRAIERLQKRKNLKISYLVGHGEPALWETNTLDASEFRMLAQAERIEVEEVQLSDGSQMLDIEAPLFIVGPKRQVTPTEQQAIISFLQRGGRVVVAVDYSKESLSSYDFLQYGGVAIDPRPLVRMLEGEGGDRQMSSDLPIRLFRQHPITEFLSGSASVLFSDAIAFKRVRSSIETDMTSVQDLLSYQISPEERMTIASLSLWPNNASLLVLGDSSWMTNSYISRVYNRDLVRGILLWSADPESLSALDASEAGSSSSPVYLVSSLTVRRTLLAFLVLVELCVLICLLIFSRRQRRSLQNRLREA